MDNNTTIEEKMANYIATCVLCAILRGIFGESDAAKSAIKEMLIDEYIYQHVHEILPPLDENFFTNMIAVLASNGTVCEELNKLRLPPAELEAAIKTKVMDKLKKISDDFFRLGCEGDS
jgi:hypothetical protein